MRTPPLAWILALTVAALPLWRAGPSSATTLGQPPGAITIDADEIAYDAATDVVTARGNVRVTHPEFRLFADLVTVDLRRQIVTAEGRVRLLDAAGRELRGTRLVYNVATQEGTLSDAETVVSQIYFRGAQVDVAPQRVTIRDGLVTTCDPRRPLYRITARSIEIVPGRELVARDAALWLGNVRVLSLRVYRVPLDPREVTPPLLPSAGGNQTDGVWLGVGYRYEVELLRGELFVKYGTRSGFFAFNTLTRERPAGSLSLAAGRTQIVDVDGVLRPVMLGELALRWESMPLGNSSLEWSATVAGGWFNDQDRGLATTRLEAAAAVRTPAVPVGPRLTIQAEGDVRLSAYGTGERRQVARGSVALTYALDGATTAALRYTALGVWGATPFLFDRVDPATTVRLELARSLRTQRLRASVTHNFTVPETTLAAEVGAQVAPRVFLAVGAVYNLRTSAFEDIDYTVEYTCDCLRVGVTYRQVRRELWLNVTLVPSPNLGFTLPP